MPAEFRWCGHNKKEERCKKTKTKMKQMNQEFIITGCSDLFFHLTQQVDHHHASLSISVSHSHSATRTRNHQFIGHIAVWEKHTHTHLREGATTLIVWFLGNRNTNNGEKKCGWHWPAPTLFLTMAIEPTTFRCFGLSLAKTWTVRGRFKGCKHVIEAQISHFYL